MGKLSTECSIVHTIQYNNFIYTQLKLKLKSLWGRVQSNETKTKTMYIQF